MLSKQSRRCPILNCVFAGRWIKGVSVQAVVIIVVAVIKRNKRGGLHILPAAKSADHPAPDFACARGDLEDVVRGFEVFSEAGEPMLARTGVGGEPYERAWKPDRQRIVDTFDAPFCGRKGPASQ